MPQITVELRDCPHSPEQYEAELCTSEDKSKKKSKSFKINFEEIEETLMSLRIFEHPGGKTEAVLLGDKKYQVLKDKIGVYMFNTIFSGEGFDCYRTALENSRKLEMGLSIRLKIKPHTLVNIPWEYMYDSKIMDSYLALSKFVYLSRLVELENRDSFYPAAPVGDRLRMLVVMCKPSTSLERYPLFDERREKEWLDRLNQDSRIDIEYLQSPASLTQLKQKLRDNQFDIMHFLGHGDFDDQGNGILVFEDDKSTSSHQVTGEQLGQVLACCPNLRFVYLNSCNSGRNSEKSIDSVATSLLKHVPQVKSIISMLFKIDDKIGPVFARHFYDQLVYGKSMEESIQKTRQILSEEKKLEKKRRLLQWGIPVHYTKSQEPFQLVTAPWKLWWLKDYLRSVEKKFHNWSDQYTSLKVDQLLPIWLTGEKATKKEKGTDLFDIVKKHNSLVILGNPGSGKTTAVEWLAMKYAAGKLRSDDAVNLIPRLVNLKDYSQKDDLTRLIGKFTGIGLQFSEYDLKRLLESEKWLLLFDGLNEVDEKNRPQVVEELNNIIKKVSPGSKVIVTSRESGYSANLAGEVMKIRELDDQSVRYFLKRYLGEEQSEKVFGQMDTRLKDIGRNPLMLKMIVDTVEKSETGKIPSTRAALYNKFLDQILESWWTQRKEVRESVALPDIKGILTLLGFEMHAREVLYLPVYTGEKIVRDYLKEIDNNKRSTPISNVANLIRELSGTKILQKTPDGKNIEFIFQSIEEFFAANRLHKMWNAGNYEAASQYYNNPWWSDTIVMLAEFMDKNAAEKLIEDITEKRSKNIFLAMRCVERSAEGISERLRKKVVNNLEVYFEKAQPVVEKIADQQRTQAVLQLLNLLLEKHNQEPVMRLPFMQKILREMKKLNNEFDGMSIVNKKGQMVMLPVAPGVVNQNFLERDYIAKVLKTGKPYTSDPFLAKSGNYIVVVSAPVREEEVIGVLTGSFHLAKGIEKLAQLDKRAQQTGTLDGFFYRDRSRSFNRAKNDK